MSTIKFKRSSVSGKIPLVGDLDYGEMALNYADGVLYYKNSRNAIASLSSGGTFNTSTLVATAVTATYAQSFNTSTLVATAVTATNASKLLGGAVGSIPYQISPNVTDFIAIGQNGYVLTSNGSTATWQASSGGSLTSQYFGSNLGTVTTLNFTTGTTATLVGSVLTIRATGSGSSTGQFTPNVYTTSSTSTAVIDVTNIDQYNITSLAADVTFSVTSTVTPNNGQRLLIRIRSDATPRNLTWTQTANQFRTIGISFPTITSASKLVYIGCVYNAADGYWDLISSLQQP
jgi:hypothetical protein